MLLTGFCMTYLTTITCPGELNQVSFRYDLDPFLEREADSLPRVLVIESVFVHFTFLNHS